MRRNRIPAFMFWQRIPDAVALIKGSESYRGIHGEVKFYRMARGVMVVAEVYGLPASREVCGNDIFAFHIHSGSSCSGTPDDPFSDTGTHLNRTDCPHPYHMGDMPPLFTSGGYAFLAFLSGRFTLGDIVGKVVIIHDRPDDFTTQPSGNAGNKIACGVITPTRR